MKPVITPGIEFLHARMTKARLCGNHEYADALYAEIMKLRQIKPDSRTECPNLGKEIVCPDCKEWTSVCEPCCNGAMSEDCTCNESGGDAA